jgi:Tol biopolymer transport system component
MATGRTFVLLGVLGTLSLAAGCGREPAISPPDAMLDDIWVAEPGADPPTRLTTASEAGRKSTAASVSGDGRYVAFESDADLLGEGVPAGADNVWLLDRETQQLTRLSAGAGAGRASRSPSISGDGRIVVFASNADLLGTGVTAGQIEIWRYEVGSGEVTRLTTSPPSGGISAEPTASTDGSAVAFTSDVDFETGRTADAVHIWLADAASGAVTRATPANVSGARSRQPSIDGAGRRVAFESNADLLGENLAGGLNHIWLYDATSRALTRVTPPVGPTRESEAPSISADGTKIVFHSDADLLNEGRPDSVDEIWLYDIPAASLRRLTSTWAPPRDADLPATLQPDSQNARISADGTKVVFASDADFLEEGVLNGYPHAWVYDLEDDSLARIDTSAGTGSGVAIDAPASTVVLFASAFDAFRAAAVAVASAPPRPATLTAGEIDQDLDAFQRELEGRWAYLNANGVDYRAAIDVLRAKAAGGMDTGDYARELHRIISMFIDGHAGVSGARFADGYLPFLIEPSGGRFVAFSGDRTGFVDADHPYVTAIDGRPIADWIAAVEPFNPQGAPQYRTRHALRQMRYLQFQRALMELPRRDEVVVQVASADGRSTREVTLPVAASGPTYGAWPRTESGLLDGNVGYLRIESMNDDAVEEVAAWMPKFRETRGLVVDVRGNGGGSRDALRALFPYVMAEDAEPRVVNAAKYRLHPDYAADHLGGSRYLYRESWDGWTPEERDAIAAFRQTFTPQWTQPEDEFSEWHYLVMSRRMNPDAFVYGKPVVILLDAKSFSATDIFVSAFKGYPNVTLIGSPSGGGSARIVGVELPVSRLSVRLASMASFQISGRLHDGHGTEPDVVVEPSPEYFLVNGEDNILQAALARIR